METKVLFVLFGLIALSSAYGSGGPLEVCESLTPGHPSDPQDPKSSPFPYTVFLDKTKVSPGGIITITISSPAQATLFKGFMIQARKSNYEKEKAPQGTFSSDSKDVKTVKCGGIEGSTVTHSGPVDKKEVVLKWTAPKEKGTYVILATIAKDGAVYWVKQTFGNISVN